MAWYVYIAWFFAGAFLANAIPHTVQGTCGNRFQTPFASPRGVGESSAAINVIWGLANFAIGGALLYIFFPKVSPPPWPLCIAALIGALAMALYLASAASLAPSGGSYSASQITAKMLGSATSATIARGERAGAIMRAGAEGGLSACCRGR